jgi:threonine/homoserine/homoserine lactone efflux protein
VIGSALLAYAVPALLITLLPGPDTIMVLSTAVRAGRAAAARAAWGVATGLVIWGAAAALGLAAALRSSAGIYETFRYCCAAYLLLLALQAMQASRRRSKAPAPAPRSESAAASRILGWGYRRALFTCLLNPKLGIFFVVFLPQFIPDGAAVAGTSFALAGLQAVEALLWYLLLGRVAGAASRRLSSGRLRAWLDRVTAGVFVAFGLRIATEGQR